MAFFGRKNSDNYEYDDEDALIEEEEKEDRRLTKKFKDLKRTNKRRRKEPPKPWGKKERMIVLIAVSITVLIAAFLALSSENAVSLRFSNFSLNFPKIDFGSLNPFAEQTIIIQKK